MMDEVLDSSEGVDAGVESVAADGSMPDPADDASGASMPQTANNAVTSVSGPPRPALQKDVQLLRDSGAFTAGQINTFIDQQRPYWRCAGLSEQQIDNYYGVKPFDISTIGDFFRNSARDIWGDGRDDIPSFDQYWTAGWRTSDSDLAYLLTTHQHPQDIGLPEDSPPLQRTVQGLGQMVGDAPFMAAGYVAGGGPVDPITGAGGAFALPAGLRVVLMDAYDGGQINNFQDFWALAKKAVWETFKGEVIGEATAGVGGGFSKVAMGTAAVGNAAVDGALQTAAARTVAKFAQAPAELATMTTVGAALERRMPSAQDFIDNAMVLFGFHLAKMGVEQVQGMYEKMGFPPVAADFPSHSAGKESEDATPKGVGSYEAPVPGSPDRPIPGEPVPEAGTPEQSATEEGTQAKPAPVMTLVETGKALRGAAQALRDEFIRKETSPSQSARKIVANPARMAEIFEAATGDTSRVAAGNERGAGSDEDEARTAVDAGSGGSSEAAEARTFNGYMSETRPDNLEIVDGGMRDESGFQTSNTASKGRQPRERRQDLLSGGGRKRNLPPLNPRENLRPPNNENVSVVKGVEKARNLFHLHHPWPMYLGGPELQNLIKLSEELHIAYHRRVQEFADHRKGEVYYRNMDATTRHRIFDQLFTTTKEFDAEFGTRLYDAMINEMSKAGFFERGLKW